MKALFLAALVALPCVAEEPVKDVEGFAPVFCLEPQERTTLAKKLVSLQAENERLTASVTMSVPVWVPLVVGVVALGVGVGVGYGISQVKK